MQFTNHFFPKNSNFSGIVDRQEQPNLAQKKIPFKQGQKYSYKLQETICSFFVEKTKKESPEVVLQTFANLFFYQQDRVEPQVNHALDAIIRFNQETIFQNTLKRCCYILINNWCSARHQQHLQKLIQLLSQFSEGEPTSSPYKKRLKLWLKIFFDSHDYQELSLLVSRYNNPDKYHWSNRYASYLLASQAIDSNNPREQREAARVVSRQLKEQFNFDLAMYTARSPSAVTAAIRHQNPTVLGDDVLRLIQKLLEKRGRFGYKSLSNIFIKQVEGVVYKQFKKSFFMYLTFYLEDHKFIERSGIYMGEYLNLLYQEHDEEIWNIHLLLRTCNRLIEYLTIQNKKNPSPVFTVLAIQDESLTLAILLLKVILVSKNSYIHLEACIGYLIQYYENSLDSECKWLISFLETLKVALSIYAEGSCYNLVSIKPNNSTKPVSDISDYYRIFSQVKLEQKNDINARKKLEVWKVIEKLLRRS